MIYFWIIIFLSVWGLLLYTKTSSFKGWVLEWKIDRLLNDLARKFGGIQLKNLLIPYNGGTQQIDNLLMTSKAIYVIEAKNYSGFIYGSLNHEQWTMTKRTVKSYRNQRGKKYTKSFIHKNKFYNPIKQNETHVKALKTLLKSPNLPIINMVVFGQRALLKEINTDKSHPVIRFKELKSSVKTFEKNHSDKINHKELMAFVDDVFFYNITNRKQRKAHVKAIKSKYQIKKG